MTAALKVGCSAGRLVEQRAGSWAAKKAVLKAVQKVGSMVWLTVARKAVKMVGRWAAPTAAN